MAGQPLTRARKARKNPAYAVGDSVIVRWSSYRARPDGPLFPGFEGRYRVLEIDPERVRSVKIAAMTSEHGKKGGQSWVSPDQIVRVVRRASARTNPSAKRFEVLNSEGTVVWSGQASSADAARQKFRKASGVKVVEGLYWVRSIGTGARKRKNPLGMTWQTTYANPSKRRGR